MWDIRIILLTFLCVALYTGQSFCNRLFSGNYKGSPDIATPVFSSVYGVLVAVVTLHLLPDGPHTLFSILAISVASLLPGSLDMPEPGKLPSPITSAL